MTHRVLFVDDEPSVTDGIRTTLRKASFEILTANSGQAALDLLAAEPVDVIVSDERMPGMSGSQLLAKVRTEYPDTMRMVLSGQADLQAAVNAINDGAIFRFLLKPCDPYDLAESVEEALTALERRRRFHRWEEDKVGLGANPDATLDRALDALVMAFQPIHLNTCDQVYAYEALVRCTDADITRPDQLFGLAEAIERVPDVDAAIRRAIALRIPHAPEDASIFVNVHPDSLMDERLFADDDPLVPFAERIVLEITERSSLHDTNALESRVSCLRAQGFRIAIDDLGAGYAGLSSFALLNPDVVKFDMGLIRGIHDDPTRARVIQSMTALCHTMDILTVAEGVEVLDELDCVVELGCDLIQGFVLGKPEFTFPGEARAAA